MASSSLTPAGQPRRSCRSPTTTRSRWPRSGLGCAASMSVSSRSCSTTRPRTPSGPRSSGCSSGASRSSSPASDRGTPGPGANVPLETAEQAPVPVRTVTRLVGEWIGRLGKIWVEGQIAELSRRGGTVFMTLRDPVAAVSVRVICTSAVLDAAVPAPDVGARVVIWAKPEFNAARGSFALTALQLKAVGIGELLARLERLRTALAAEGLFATERKRRLPFLPRSVGLICGRDSAAERDVLRNAARRWPAVTFRVEQVAVQGSRTSEEIIEALQRLDADKAVD